MRNVPGFVTVRYPALHCVCSFAVRSFRYVAFAFVYALHYIPPHSDRSCATLLFYISSQHSIRLPGSAHAMPRPRFCRVHAPAGLHTGRGPSFTSYTLRSVAGLPASLDVHPGSFGLFPVCAVPFYSCHGSAFVYLSFVPLPLFVAVLPRSRLPRHHHCQSPRLCYTYRVAVALPHSRTVTAARHTLLFYHTAHAHVPVPRTTHIHLAWLHSYRVLPTVRFTTTPTLPRYTTARCVTRAFVLHTFCDRFTLTLGYTCTSGYTHTHIPGYLVVPLFTGVTVCRCLPRARVSALRLHRSLRCYVAVIYIYRLPGLVLPETFVDYWPLPDYDTIR